MSEFATTYRALVVPRLRQLCASEGARLALGLVDWSDAVGAVWDTAYRLGAYALPDTLPEELYDWVQSQLLAFDMQADTEANPTRLLIGYLPGSTHNPRTGAAWPDWMADGR